jgi:branched-chain amino acid transport system substrate-binding protein
MRAGTFASAVALAGTFALVAAACGGDDGESTSETTAAETTTTVAGGGETTTTAAGGTTTTAGGGNPTDMPAAVCEGEPDTSLDAKLGAGAGRVAQQLACAAAKPLEAEGEPIVIGFQNPKGDPAGSFPEFEEGILAAEKFINERLGGFGADLVAGTPGRPVRIEVCSTAINPADSQKCANELAGKKPFAVISSINFFGNHYPVFKAAGIPTFVSSPVTIADFTTDGIFAIGTGGGCVGTHTGLVEYTVNTLGARRIAVPWADTPPGVVCYHDLEKKPLNVLKGVTPGPGVTETFPEIEHIGIPIKPATPDLTPQVTQILDFDPEAIIFSGQSADCWNLVGSLGRSGWTNDDIPMVLAGSCLDLPKMQEIGELTHGITIVGAPPVSQPQLLTGLLRKESESYVAAMKAAGTEGSTVKGFAGQGFMSLMIVKTLLDEHLANGGELDAASFAAFMPTTSNVHAYGGTPLGCADGVAPYVSVCASSVTAQRWTGEGFEVLRENFSGVYLVEGTPLDTGA